MLPTSNSVTQGYTIANETVRLLWRHTKLHIQMSNVIDCLIVYAWVCDVCITSLQIFVAILAFQDQVTWLNATGLIVAITGAWLYKRSRIQQSSKRWWVLRRHSTYIHLCTCICIYRYRCLYPPKLGCCLLRSVFCSRCPFSSIKDVACSPWHSLNRTHIYVCRTVQTCHAYLLNLAP